MTDASFVDRVTRVIDRRPEPCQAYAFFQRAALEARQPSKASHMPDIGPWWRQPLAVCLVSYVLVLMILAIVTG